MDLIICACRAVLLSGAAFVSGPIWDRANRVTQACHLERIAPKHDRRIGRIGDFTDTSVRAPRNCLWRSVTGAKDDR